MQENHLEKRLSKSDLPPAGTKRWVVRRKAAVIAGIRAGVITAEDACKIYSLSAEELQSWQRLVDRHGLRGLRATDLKKYRHATTRTKNDLNVSSNHHRL